MTKPGDADSRGGRPRPPVALYPLLLAAFPPLAMFAHNVNEVLLSRLWGPLLGSCALAGVLLAGFRAVLRDLHRAALITAVAVILFFSYGHVYELLWRQGGLTSYQRLDFALLPLWALVMLVAGYGIIHTRRELAPVTRALNVVAALLLVPSILTAAPVVVNRGRALRAVRRAVAAPDPAPGARPRARPDIYYIILDRYAGERALRNTYGFDNREFWEFLESRGFYVAYDSKANYPRTLVSLTSSLNMCHLDRLAAAVGRKCRDNTIIYHLLQDHAVGRFLKRQGYKYVHLGPGCYEPTARSVIADVDGGQPHREPGEFLAVFLRTTLLRPLLRALGVVRERNEDHREHILYELKRLPELAEIPGPKFVFAHILLPHMPYVFGPNGEAVNQRELLQSPNPFAGYLGQLQFTNRQMEKVIDEILRRTEGDPVIILQADEGGPGPGREDEENPDALSGQEAHASILNAYRAPGLPRNQLYPSITPVNTFRLLFRHYFGADLPPLEDRTYARRLGYPFWFEEPGERGADGGQPGRD